MKFMSTVKRYGAKVPAGLAVGSMMLLAGPALADTTAAPIDITTAADYMSTNGTTQGNKIGLAVVTVAALFGVYKWLKRAF